jgi:hypothetical protein
MSEAINDRVVLAAVSEFIRGEGDGCMSEKK